MFQTKIPSWEKECSQFYSKKQHLTCVSLIWALIIKDFLMIIGFELKFREISRLLKI